MYIVTIYISEIFESFNALIFFMFTVHKFYINYDLFLSPTCIMKAIILLHIKWACIHEILKRMHQSTYTLLLTSFF